MEDYVSGNAVTRLYKEYTKEELPAYRIAELARSGDKMALQVWDAFAQALAHALSWTVNITDPEIVIIGGSVLKSSDLYWDKAECYFVNSFVVQQPGILLCCLQPWETMPDLLVRLH